MVITDPPCPPARSPHRGSHRPFQPPPARPLASTSTAPTPPGVTTGTGDPAAPPLTGVALVPARATHPGSPNTSPDLRGFSPPFTGGYLADQRRPAHLLLAEVEGMIGLQAPDRITAALAMPLPSPWPANSLPASRHPTSDHRHPGGARPGLRHPRRHAEGSGLRRRRGRADPDPFRIRDSPLVPD